MENRIPSRNIYEIAEKTLGPKFKYIIFLHSESRSGICGDIAIKLVDSQPKRRPCQENGSVPTQSCAIDFRLFLYMRVTVSS